MSEAESYYVAASVMLAGLLLSFLVYWFFSQKAESAQGRLNLTRWQKYIVPAILLIITNLITAIGFAILFIFPYSSITFVGWVRILKNFLSCFGCLLGISLFYYYGALLYYYSGLHERMKEKWRK